MRVDIVAVVDWPWGTGMPVGEVEFELGGSQVRMATYHVDDPETEMVWTELITA